MASMVEGKGSKMLFSKGIIILIVMFVLYVIMAVIVVHKTTKIVTERTFDILKLLVAGGCSFLIALAIMIIARCYI